jgi:hypothetical protein
MVGATSNHRYPRWLSVSRSSTYSTASLTFTPFRGPRHEAIASLTSGTRKAGGFFGSGPGSSCSTLCIKRSSCFGLVIRIDPFDS